MHFLIQSDDTVVSFDNEILKDCIRRRSNNKIHSFLEISLANLQEASVDRKNSELSECIPVGSLEFVEEHLKKYHNVDKMNPIEVPLILMKPEFLCRSYSIVPYRSLPKSGEFFVKDASNLKYFCYCGNVEDIPESDLKRMDKTALYVVSDVVDIASEYRCLVSSDKLLAVNHYQGNPLIFPDPKIIQKMIVQYIADSTRPKSYTIDIAVLKDGRTCILEVHPWACVGLYGYLFDDGLPYCYADGYNYYLQCNKPVMPHYPTRHDLFLISLFKQKQETEYIYRQTTNPKTRQEAEEILKRIDNLIS